VGHQGGSCQGFSACSPRLHVHRTRHARSLPDVPIPTTPRALCTDPGAHLRVERGLDGGQRLLLSPQVVLVPGGERASVGCLGPAAHRPVQPVSRVAPSQALAPPILDPPLLSPSCSFARACPILQPPLPGFQRARRPQVLDLHAGGAVAAWLRLRRCHTSITSTSKWRKPLCKPMRVPLTLAAGPQPAARSPAWPTRAAWPAWPAGCSAPAGGRSSPGKRRP
jgi:hypothetical protein